MKHILLLWDCVRDNPALCPFVGAVARATAWSAIVADMEEPNLTREVALAALDQKSSVLGRRAGQRFVSLVEIRGKQYTCPWVSDLLPHGPWLYTVAFPKLAAFFEKAVQISSRQINSPELGLGRNWDELVSLAKASRVEVEWNEGNAAEKWFRRWTSKLNFETREAEEMASQLAEAFRPQ